MTLLHKKIRILYKTNQTLVKRRKTNKTYIRIRNVLTIKDVYNSTIQKEIIKQQLSKRLIKENIVQTRSSSLRCYERCDKTNYNVRTCQKVKETSKKDNNIKDN